MTEIITPIGRIVSGNPMFAAPVKDKKGIQKLDKDGKQRVSFYTGLAIAKGSEQHWNQTEWGTKLWNIGQNAFPGGDANLDGFAWKITDGDSNKPNQKGKIPNQREGWPGHWVLNISNGYPFTCYDNSTDKNREIFNPFNAMKTKDDVKAGDYGLFVLEVTGNNIKGPVETSGLYINPQLFSLRQRGAKIVSANEVDPMTTLATANLSMPANMQIDPVTAGGNSAPPPQQQQPGNSAPPPQQQQPGNSAPPPQQQQQAVVTQNDGFVQNAGGAAPPPPASQLSVIIADGTVHTIESLKASSWTDEQIGTCKPANVIPF